MNGEKRRNLTIPSATANYFFFFVAFLSRRCYLIAFCLSRFSSCLDNQPFSVGRVASLRRSLKWTDSLLGVRDRSFETEWMEIVGCAFRSFGPCQFEFSTLAFLCFQIMVGEVERVKTFSSSSFPVRFLFTKKQDKTITETPWVHLFIVKRKNIK